MADKSQARPKNVVMVDAENPLVEVHGEFFWREDHERILADAREEAYRQGYADARAEVAKATTTQEVVLRRRPRLVTRLLRRVILTALVASLLLVTLGIAIEGLLART